MPAAGHIQYMNRQYGKWNAQIPRATSRLREPEAKPAAVERAIAEGKKANGAEGKKANGAEGKKANGAEGKN